MKKIAAAFLFILLSITLSSCSLFKTDPNKAVNEGLQGFSEVKRMASRLVISGTVKSPDGEKPENVKFSVITEGRTDNSDSESPLVDMSFKLSGDADSAGGSGTILFKSVDKKMYFSLASIDAAGEKGEELKTQMASFIGAWWSLPLGETSPFGKLSDQQNELMKKLKGVNLFVSATEEGEEEIEGISATRYRVEVSKDALKQFISDLARITENQLSPDEETAIAESLKEVEFSGAVWVGKKDDLIHRISGTVAVSPAQGSSASFEVDFIGWDFGKKVAVEAPAQSQEFNPLTLLPLLGAVSSFNAQKPEAPAAGNESAPAVPAPVPAE